MPKRQPLPKPTHTRRRSPATFSSKVLSRRARVFHQQHQVQQIGRRGLELEVGVERVDLIV